MFLQIKFGGGTVTERAQCGRCGAILVADNQFCTQCGAPRARRAITPQGAVTDRSRPANAAQIALAVLLDLVFAGAVVAALLLIAFNTDDVNVWVLCALVLVVAVAAHLAALLFAGQSLSARIVGMRLVSSITASAPGLRFGPVRFVDIRRGHDPLDPQMAPFEIDLEMRDLRRGSASAPINKKGWVLVIDEERRIALTGSFVVGRNPAVAAHETAVAIPDLGRMLSKAHLRFDIESDGVVFVTDLGSTNGTQLDALDLGPHQRAALTEEARIYAGEHVLRIESRARSLQGVSR